jgi:quinol monooxygenase YgiN
MIALSTLAHHRPIEATKTTQENIMIVRLLHYKIKPGMLDEYLGLFNDLKERVVDVKGLSFFNVFRDLEDPNTLFLASVFEDDADMETYNEVGPNKEYSDAVGSLIESFGLAMAYEVSGARPIPSAAQTE